MASQGQAFTGCGTPVAVTAVADGSSGSQSFTSTPRYVPSAVQATGAMWYPNTKITATVGLGSTACTYESFVPQSTPVDLAFVSCNDGSVPGTTLIVDSATLSGTLNGYTGYAPLQVSIPRSIDDLNFCTSDSCGAGTVYNTPKASGTACDDGQLCNGPDACNGGGAQCLPTMQQPPPNAAFSDGDDCTTDTCASNTVSHTPIAGCGAPPSGAGAAPTDPTVPTSFGTAVSFLYTSINGSTPVQTGMNPTTISAVRAAVVRGRVFIADGTTPLSGATVKIVGHTEYGQTSTRSDGYYDMAVNGGDGLVVEVSKTGYLTSQRHVSPRWHDYSVATDVLLVARDTTTHAVTLNSSVWQAVQGTPTTHAIDPDQPVNTTRTATLLFQPGTLVTTSGFSGSTLTIRQTEYTVGGANGLKAMPAELPPTSAYTYAVELSADEAEAQSLTSIAFNKPAFFYIENFTGTSYDATGVQSNVPTGSYDRVTGSWKPEANGNILKVVANTGTSVDLSLDGTNAMSSGQYSAFGIVAEERAALAPLYPVGTSLWRTPIAHFSPWDLNWNAGLPSTALGPPDAAPRVDTPRPDPCEVHGSIVECENQTLRESVPIVGTPFSLVYSSARQAGSRPTINIPLSDARSFPVTPLRMEADVTAAGRRFSYALPALANQSVQWTWDRKDVYGNLVQGAFQATVDVRYVYSAASTNFTSNFGALGGASVGGNRASREMFVTRSYALTLQGFDAKALGLGGWQIDAMQVYDSTTGSLLLGSRPTSVDNLRQVFAASGVAGALLNGVGADGAGDLYVGATEANGFPGGSSGIYRISSGTRTAISSGSGASVWFADNTPLTSVLPMVSNLPPAVRVTRDGSLLVSDSLRIFRAAPTGSRLTSLIAGTQSGGVTPADGVLARSAAFTATLSAAIEAPDGTVLFADSQNKPRVWRIGGDGKLETIAGTGTAGDPASTCISAPESCVARSTAIQAVRALVADPAGNVYFFANGRVWRVSTSGTLRLFAGDGSSSPQAPLDGSLATAVSLPSVKDLAWRDGTLYLADATFHLIRRIGLDGVIRTVAGDPTLVATGLGASATSSHIDGPVGFGFAPDNSMYIATDRTDLRLFRMFAPAPTTSAGVLIVPSPDGTETYEIGTDGRHNKTRTVDGGKTKYAFGYTSGRLTSITDAGGNVTTIDYGSPITIVSPRSGTTTLALDGNGYLASIANPATETILLQHSASGLLTQLTDPKSQVHTFVHSSSGRVTKDKNALNGTGGLRLAQSFTPSGWDVAVTTPEGRTTSHSVSFAPATTNSGKRVELRTHTSPLGLVSTEERYSDLGRKMTYPDGTTIDVTYGSDPRFGATRPYVSKLTTTSGGQSSSESVLRDVNGLSSTDPFSFTWSKETRSFSATSADTRSPIEIKYTPGSPATRTTTTFLGRQVVEQLDSSDRVTKVTIPGAVPGAGSSTLVPVDFYYDGNGRLWKIDQNGGVAGSRTTTMTFATGKDWVDSIATPLSTTGYTNFDGVGRAQTTKLPGWASNNLIKLTSLYDLNGNTKQVTMPLANGRDHYFSATPEDLLGVYTPPSVYPGGATTTIYDRDDLLMSLLEPGATATYTRDDMGRVTGVSYPLPSGSTESITREHDSSGRLWKLNASDGPVNLTYTYSGKMLTKESYTGAFSHDVNNTYDDYFRLKTRNIDGALGATFKYDADGILNEVNGTWGTYKMFRTSGSTSSPVNGMLTGTELGGANGLTDTYEYDVFGALKHYTLKYAGAMRYEVQYTRDSKGRVSTKAETVWNLNGNAQCSTTYGYDSADRGFLVSDWGDCPWPFLGTTYDLDGNYKGGAGWTYDLQDRLVSDPDWNYTTSADGDQINGTLKTDYYNQWQFDFDLFGNLRRFYGPYYSNWYPSTYPFRTYLIDGRNRRVGIKDNGTFISQLLYDDDRVVAMYRNGAMGHFVYGTKSHVPDLLIRADGAYRVVSDQLGSVKLIIRSDGTIVEARSYNAWGVPVWTAGSGLWNYAPFGFAGGIWDERANRIRFGARDYNPWASSWTSKDPSRFGGGFNFYAYANNDPVNFIDRSGHVPEPVDISPGPVDPEVSHAFICLLYGVCLPPTLPDAPPRPRSATPPSPCSSVPDPQPNACTDPCDGAQGQVACHTCCDFYGKDPRECKSSCCGMYR